MNRLFGLSAVLGVSLILLTACSASPAASSAPENQSASISAESSVAVSSEPAVSAASSELVAPAASSDVASSDIASSDKASSDKASSDVASSDKSSSDAASSEPALSGPSGLAEMNVSMKYISIDEVLAIVQSGDKTKVILDLRKPADAKAAHIEGSIFAPVNKAVDNNNYADALANIAGTLSDATGNEVGEGKDIILVCYQGKKYAQAATDILNALGADMGHVYTMEGGFKAWNEAGNPTVAG